MRVDLGELTTRRALTYTGGGSADNEVLTSTAGLQSSTVRVGLVWDLNL
jgi:hypothetical protein